MRVAWCYQHLASKAPHRTVVSVLADRMEWSMTGVQVQQWTGSSGPRLDKVT